MPIPSPTEKKGLVCNHKYYVSKIKKCFPLFAWRPLIYSCRPE